ncbi:MAG: HIRAN protein [Calditrichaeota bacterium]|nr:HIRAN protein [Calditrichota bacterium]
MLSRRKFLQQILALPLLGLLGFRELTAKEHPERGVLMNQFSIAGFQYYRGPALLPLMKVGERISLEVEPTNPHDEFAVKILYRGRQIGYVPRSDNRHISRLLQNGVPLVGRIAGIQPEAPPWQQVQIRVWLLQQ